MILRKYGTCFKLAAVGAGALGFGVAWRFDDEGREALSHRPWVDVTRVSAKSLDQNARHGERYQAAITEARKFAENIQVLLSGHYL